MIVASVLVLSGFIAVVWVFLRLGPAAPRRRPVRVYNGVVLAAALGAGLLAAGHLRAALIRSPDAAWWLFLAPLAGMLAAGAVLAVAGLLRNLVLFRTPRPRAPRPGSRPPPGPSGSPGPPGDGSIARQPARRRASL